MWVHLLIEDKCIQISGNLLSQEMVSQELQPIFWDNFKSKKQIHIMVLSAQVIIVHQKTNCLHKLAKFHSNLVSSLGQTAEQFGSNCWYCFTVLFFLGSFPVKFCKHMLILLIKVKGCWYFWCCCPKIQRMCCFGQHRGHACGARKRESI